MTINYTVYYRVPVPNGTDAKIEVYGNEAMGWYQWRVVTASGKVEKDSANLVGNMGYKYPEIALRDALNATIL